jgi:predicted amidohydrolase
MSALVQAAGTEDETIRVASLAINSKMGDPVTNLDRVASWAEKASRAGARFAVFPEEYITGSLNKSTLSREERDRAIAEAGRMAPARLARIARERTLTLVVGTIERRSERYYNSALVFGPEGHLTTYDKIWLPDGEQRFFEPGTTLPVLQSQGWRFTLGICADLDRGEFFEATGRAGAELFLLSVAGSGFPELVGADRDQTRQAEAHKALHVKLMKEHAVRSGLYIFYANQAGRSGNDWFPGLALVADPRGQIVGEHLPGEGMLVTEVARNAIRDAQKALPSRNPPECRNSEGKPVTVGKKR